MDITLRPYEYGSDDFKKALILRYNILNLISGINSTSLEFIFGDHADEKDHFMLGAFDGDTLLGTLNLQKFYDYLLVRQFAVHKSLQGTGIGMKLIKYAHEFAIEQGYRKLELHARMNTLGFYQKAGYRMTGKYIFGSNITLVVMRTEL